MLSRVKLTNAHIVRGRPTLKNNTECFRNGLVRELKEKQGKFSKHSETHGPHRRNEKSECQEFTCKIGKSLNRGTCIKFESREICVVGNQCDKSDFDFHNAEHKELPVIKRDSGFLWNYCDNFNNSSYSFNFVSQSDC